MCAGDVLAMLDRRIFLDHPSSSSNTKSRRLSENLLKSKLTPKWPTRQT